MLASVQGSSFSLPSLDGPEIRFIFQPFSTVFCSVSLSVEQKNLANPQRSEGEERFSFRCRLNNMPTFLATQSYVLKPSTTPELTIPGGTIRGMVLEKMEKLVEHVLSQREGEVR